MLLIIFEKKHWYPQSFFKQQVDFRTTLYLLYAGRCIEHSTVLILTLMTSDGCPACPLSYLLGYFGSKVMQGIKGR